MSQGYPQSYPFQGRTGPEAAPDGSYQPFRVDRTGALVTQDSAGKYYEAVKQGKVWGLFTGPTTTGIAAGHLVAASAAAVAQHAIINPVGSGVNLSILRFANAYVSGTVPAGGIYVGMVSGCTLTASVTTFSSKFNLNPAAAGGGQAVTVSVAASTGSGLTNGAAVVTSGVLAVPATTAGSLAELSGVTPAEDVNGLFIVPPGWAFTPLWSGAGTSVLTNMCTVWEEIPV